jgi:hypothetical protein
MEGWYLGGAQPQSHQISNHTLVAAAQDALPQFARPALFSPPSFLLLPPPRRLFSPQQLPFPSPPARSLALHLSKLRVAVSRQLRRSLINISTTSVSVNRLFSRHFTPHPMGPATHTVRSRVTDSCYRAGTMGFVQVRQHLLGQPRAQPQIP